MGESGNRPHNFLNPSCPAILVLLLGRKTLVLFPLLSLFITKIVHNHRNPNNHNRQVQNQNTGIHARHTHLSLLNRFFSRSSHRSPQRKLMKEYQIYSKKSNQSKLLQEDEAWIKNLPISLQERNSIFYLEFLLSKTKSPRHFIRRSQCRVFSQDISRGRAHWPVPHKLE